MQIENETVKDILVVIPHDKRIDAACATEFKGRIVDLINSGRNRILLDLAEVDFIDSSGLGALISALKSIGDNGDLALCNVRETVMSLFKLTRMDRIFQIYVSREEALDSFNALQH